MCRIPVLTALISMFLGAAALASDMDACLNDGPSAIAPMEDLKLALIERREDEMFDKLDPTGLFSPGVRQKIINELSGVAGDKAVVWCTLLQRNNFSEHHSSEVFLMRYAPDLFIYFATYAVRQEKGWVTHSISFNTDFSEMRNHLR